MDVTFGGARVAVFVDGCFWHRCPVHSTLPKANREWWSQKLADNVDRDRRVDSALTQKGWRVLRIWEHEDPEGAADRIAAVVESAKP